MRLFIPLLCLICTLALHAEDWPSARGPRGDLITRATGLAAEWPADGPKKLWSQKAGLGYSSPTAMAVIVPLPQACEWIFIIRANGAHRGLGVMDLPYWYDPLEPFREDIESSPG